MEKGNKYIRRNTVKGVNSVVATRNLKVHTKVIDLFNEGRVEEERSKYTIQANDAHWMHDLGMYINHSFKPNCRFDEFGYLVTIKGVQKGEEITFDYTTTEDEIISPFLDKDTYQIVGFIDTGKLIEECSELINQAVLQTTKPKNYSFENLFKEMADVWVQIDILRHKYPELNKIFKQQKRKKEKRYGLNTISKSS